MCSATLNAALAACYPPWRVIHADALALHSHGFHSHMLWLLVLPAGRSFVDVLAFRKVAPCATYVGVLSNVLHSYKQGATAS